MNVLLLWSEGIARGYSSPMWMTFKQALELGSAVRTGETGATVVFARRPPRAHRWRAYRLQLRAARGAEIAELRGLVRTLAQHIQVLTLQVAERDAVIEGLRQELARSGNARVVPLKRSRDDTC